MRPARIEKTMRTIRQRYGGWLWVGSGGREWGRCVRADILHLLLDGPTTSYEIATRMRISQRTVLRHLGHLQREGKVKRFREGNGGHEPAVFSLNNNKRRRRN